LFGAPIALYGAGGHPDALQCVCASAHPGRECPMHRHQDHPHDNRQAGEEAASECAIRGTLGQPDVLYLTVVAGAAVMPNRVVLHAAPESGTGVIPTRSRLLSRPAPPDSPPPRR
jgi:hypothetical protein